MKKNKNIKLSEAQEDARNNFDLDVRIEFVSKDPMNHNNYLCYSFGSSCKNSDKTYAYYDKHRAKLLKFIFMFNKISPDIISIREQQSYKIDIPNYSLLNVPKMRERDYMSELELKGLNHNLSDREFEIMILFASGCTAKKIAKMFHVTPSAVESQILKIREKTNCQDRIMLHRYVVEEGYSGLESVVT